jgi:hypothetical protein
LLISRAFSCSVRLSASMATSKKLDLVATDAIREAERLDKLEAPAKEIARQKQQGCFASE